MVETFQNILTIIGQQKKAAAEASGAAVNITYFKLETATAHIIHLLKSRRTWFIRLIQVRLLIIREVKLL